MESFTILTSDFVAALRITDRNLDRDWHEHLLKDFAFADDFVYPVRTAPGYKVQDISQGKRKQKRVHCTSPKRKRQEIADHFAPGGPHARGACYPVCTAFEW